MENIWIKTWKIFWITSTSKTTGKATISLDRRLTLICASELIFALRYAFLMNKNWIREILTEYRTLGKMNQQYVFKRPQQKNLKDLATRAFLFFPLLRVVAQACHKLENSFFQKNLNITLHFPGIFSRKVHSFLSLSWKYKLFPQ